jgi:hypothetical protein
VKRLHVTQDSNGYWLLSLEDDDGKLKLLAHLSASRDLLVQEAETLAAHGRYQGAEVLADPPQTAQSLAPPAESTEYVLPQPKRARGS